MNRSSLNLFLSACLLLIIGCGNAAKSENLTQSADPREDLVKAMRALSNVRSYRSKYLFLSTTGAMSRFKIDMEMEFVAPDRYHAIGEMNLAPQGNGKTELIVLGNDTYLKAASGKWQRQKTENDLRRIIIAFNGFQINELADAEVKFIGKDTLDGLPMLVYQYTFIHIPKEMHQWIIKTWVGVNDGLPHKVENQSEMVNQGETYNATATATYSDFNADIRIERPR